MLNLRRRFPEYRVQRNGDGEYSIRCHGGMIMPLDDDQLLAVVTDAKTATKLAKLSCVTPEYDDDTFTFDDDDESVDAVFSIMRPIRRD